MQLKPEQLSRHLGQQLLPAYLVAGDEPFQLGECTDLIRRHAREKGYAERHLFSSDTGIDWDGVYSEAHSMSLFGGQRLIEIRLGTKRPDKAASETLVQLCKEPAPDTLLLISASKLDRRKDMNSAWVKAISGIGALTEIWPVQPGRLPQWIEGRLRQAGLSATPDAVALMCERSEGNLLACAQEIDKLALLFPGGAIEPAQIQQAMGNSSRFSPFDLGDAISASDLPRALRIIDTLRSEGVEIPVVLWGVARDVRAMAAMAAGQAPGGMPPQRLRQLEGLARKLGQDSLQQALILAARVDQTLKGMQGGDPWQHLTTLVMRLCGKPLPPLYER
ncbi:DNA polymerase III subunit delta [Alcanivorax sp. JB21]|uniref:DNA polymerase III subunit delta n=1 Tax=Alcanivorax limicola TaxID=2874102 RepID=UPI001CBEECDD|nr:DNA polymerase III subunit delta [Alcanivorax limicola]MBZ2188650.1 DNA polymerase III subunit delta [Alcanivorax limicola]